MESRQRTSRPPGLAEMIDIPAIQALMDDFYQLRPIPMAVIDLAGEVLVGVGWQEACTGFHRANPESCKHCIESDTQLTSDIAPGEFRIYKCKNNMWDVATPITVGGRHVGNLFSGQFFFEDETPDYDLFRAQAGRYGYDENAYIGALDRAPRLSREAVKTAMSFFVKFAGMISELGHGNIEKARALTERERLLQSLQDAHEELQAQTEELQAANEELQVQTEELREQSDELQALNEELLATNETVRQGMERFELLAGTAGDLLNSTEPQNVIDSLCRRVMKHLDCQVFFNYLADEGAGKLRLNACAGIPEEEARRIEWLDYGAAVCGCVARDGCRIVAEHIPSTSDPRTDLVGSYGIKAYACHPIPGEGGAVIGTLSFGTRGRETFSPDDLALMKAVADQVSVAMVRMRDMETLADANRLLETVINNTHSRMAYMDARFNFVMVNQTYAESDERSPDFFPGKNHFELYPHEENERIFRNVVETGEPYFVFGKAFEYAEHPERGTSYWDWSLFPVRNAAGAVAGVVLTLTDVTERIQLQENIRRLHREQEAFLRHEVKNLFAPMQLYSQMLLMEADNLAEKQVRYLQRISESVDRVTGFVDAMKRIHDLETGTHRLRRVGHSLDAIIRQAVYDLEPVAEKSGVSIMLHIPDGEIVMPLDRQLLPGVFTNLVLNAVEHVSACTDPEEKTVAVTLEKERGWRCIRIHNRGEPIPPERLSAFFEKFNTGPEKRRGTGLGTTYAWLVTRAHGGRIEVASTAEEGTTVTVRFPEG